jgi:hypothetical protein
MVRSLEPTVTLAEGRAVGWREWASLPELGVRAVKAKVDTGARSSCLHAYDLREVQRQGRTWLSFKVHPLQRNDRYIVECESPLLEYRQVTSSNGRRELRPVIRTDIELGERRWEIELTLTRRDAMGFRMLLGREAVRGSFMVDPGRSYLASRRMAAGRGGTP